MNYHKHAARRDEELLDTLTGDEGIKREILRRLTARADGIRELLPYRPTARHMQPAGSPPFNEYAAPAFGV